MFSAFPEHVWDVNCNENAGLTFNTYLQITFIQFTMYK